MNSVKKILLFLLISTGILYTDCKKKELAFPSCGEQFSLSTQKYRHLGFKKTLSDGSTTKIYKVCNEGIFISLMGFKNYNDYLEITENAISSDGYLKTAWDEFDATLAPNNGAFDIDTNYTVVTTTTNGAQLFQIETRDLTFTKPATLMLEFNLFNTNDCHYCKHAVSKDSLTIIRIDPATLKVLGEVSNPQVELQSNPSFNSPEYKNRIGIVTGDVAEPGFYTLAARRK